MKILLADDHAIVREGIQLLLKEDFPKAEIRSTASASELLEAACNETWDVIISDISMPPGESGLEALPKLIKHSPSTPVIILSMHNPQQFAFNCLKAGASGYLTKDSAPQELVNAINLVITGKKYLNLPVANILFEEIQNKNFLNSDKGLSKREKEIFTLLVNGISIIDIAHKFSLTYKTIASIRARIFYKLKFKNNYDLIKFASQISHN